MADQSRKMKVVEKRNTLFIGFSSCMESIDEVCRIAETYLKTNIPEISSQMFALNLLMREGLTNAVRHGNRNDSGKDVGFLLKVTDKALVHMEIEDQGKGFDWGKQETSQMEEAEDHGRGIPIMQSYATWYGYNKKGNILYIQKEVTP
ncbi:ATP-binding protein [Desulfospira joergensenii]|uniref:ATP-binding protein n=1 Tax=Desulfospira joergensenii TaxID=53329 RepID=UPI0004875B5C|nr:ATP-binding protein [Desulfospira joergensenii]